MPLRVSMLMLLLGVSFAEVPQERPAGHQIRVRTGEVLVDVSVTDSGGKPVRGLTDADFEVYEDGVRQQIASFRSVVGSGTRQTASQKESPNTVPAAPVLSADSREYPHLISLVFDNVNSDRGAAVRARNAARVYVEKSLHEDDQAAVFGIGFGVHVYRRFTGDKLALISAIQEATAGNTKYPGDLSAPACCRMFRASTGSPWTRRLPCFSERSTGCHPARSRACWNSPGKGKRL